MKRVFLGIPIFGEIKEKIILLNKELSEIEGGFNLVNPDNLHFTLKFLGELSEDKINKIISSINQLDFGERFKIKLKGIGSFPSLEYSKVIWAGVENDEKLFDLHKKLDFTLSRYKANEQEFLAHLTLVRVKFVKDKHALKLFLEKNISFEFGEMIVDKIFFYESELKKEGPIYKILAEFRLS